MPNTITVAPGPKLEKGEVALWERDERHPDGEVYLAEGDDPVEVARTAGVNTRLGDGRLVEAAPKPKSSAPTATVPAPGTSTTAPATNQSVDIPGVTDTQREALAKAGFRTAADIRAASDDQLKAVGGIGPTTVERLREATKE